MSRKFQFSLRVVFLGVALSSLICAWAAEYWRRLEAEARAVAKLKDHGATFGAFKESTSSKHWQVVGVSFDEKWHGQDSDFQLLKNLHALEFVVLDNSSIGIQAVREVAALSNLKEIVVRKTANTVDAAGVLRQYSAAVVVFKTEASDRK